MVAIQSEYFPVGIAYVAASLKSAGHNVDCYIFTTPDGLRERLRSGYDALATGGLSSQYGPIKNISEIARASGILLIMGGGIITSEPELMSRALQVDFAVIGEGERAIVDLLACIESKGDFSLVDGIGYFSGEQYVLTNSRAQIEDLDSLPMPDYEGFGLQRKIDAAMSSDQYHYDIFDNPREYPIITSRSCPFMCTFCYHPSGDKYRTRSVDSIMTELKIVIPQYRINIVSIYDELFSYSDERVYEFCAKFSEFVATLPWKVGWTCQMRVSGLKDNMLDAMKDAGCYMVSYGFESYNPLVLKSMKKGITPEQIHHAIHATLDRKISIQANFIFGDKAETIETARETLDFWKDHQEAGILLAFILACPNSAMYQYCIEKGIIQDRLEFIKYNIHDIYNMTSMSDVEFLGLKVLVQKYMVRYSPYAVPIGGTSTSLTIKCPHCNEINEYKNYVKKKKLYNRMMYCRSCRKRFFYVGLLYKLFSGLIAFMTTPLLYKMNLIRREFRKKRARFYKSMRS